MILNKLNNKILVFLLIPLLISITFLLSSCGKEDISTNSNNKPNYLFKNWVKVEEIEIINKEKNIKCKIDKLTKTITWSSMSPELKHWETVYLLYDYYDKCLITPKKWDIIAYDFAGNKHLIIKKILVDSNDNISIKDNKLFVNNESLKNSKQKEYRFRDSDIKMLSLYIKDWHIPKWTYFIFWDNLTNSIDSRRFWAISLQNISWKFDL